MRYSSHRTGILSKGTTVKAAAHQQKILWGHKLTAQSWTRAGTAILVTGLLLATTSCAAPTAQSQPTEAPSSPTATTSAAAPSTTPTKAPILKPDNLPVKGPVNDGRGEYLQTTIADNDPAMTIDPS